MHSLSNSLGFNHKSELSADQNIIKHAADIERAWGENRWLYQEESKNFSGNQKILPGFQETIEFWGKKIIPAHCLKEITLTATLILMAIFKLHLDPVFSNPRFPSVWRSSLIY